jgi:hypothetical protein
MYIYMYTCRFMRPMSAQPRRKASFSNLAVIPENRSLLSKAVEKHNKTHAAKLSIRGGPFGSSHSSVRTYLFVFMYRYVFIFILIHELIYMLYICTYIYTYMYVYK